MKDLLMLDFIISVVKGFATEDKQVQHRPTSFLFAVAFNFLHLNPLSSAPYPLSVLRDDRLVHIIWNIRIGWQF